MKPPVRCSNSTVFALRLMLIFGVLSAWEVLVRFDLLDPFFMSQPTAILFDMKEAFVSGDIMPHIIVTLKEALAGLLIGTFTGIASALLLEKIDLLARILDPIIMAFYGIPKLALGPIFILWFGLGMQSKIFLAALMVYFLVLFNAYAGFKNVDQTLVNAARLMGAKKGQIMRKVILPSSSPWLLAGVKAGLGAALLGAVVGEYIGANEGLGWMVEYAGGMYNIARVFTCIITLMLIMAVLNAMLGMVERYLLKWRPTAL
ncbi:MULTISPECIES: ABC transporter permease [unclassified Pseudodesulfovibrio]|uniref:ABC transporter permease n=1 Tax=unclassified Pseudodesulfovibrio TaxID=2661612 RepID=UPI000FEC1BA5|nr:MULTISPECIES: ABC transporter permease [unclassified Pseudodesulfovibrio]MCJ2164304.1 ABC transporter permease [Pseudodesulfovibrio sp. S3-i]RWU04515.1 ABC transporter permease [Pseudodesulfovibrio sp. S3]